MVLKSLNYFPLNYCVVSDFFPKNSNTTIMYLITLATNTKSIYVLIDTNLQI